MMRPILLTLLTLLFFVGRCKMHEQDFCMWCNKTMAVTFINCLSYKILNNPFLKVDRNSVDDMKESMFGAIAGISHPSPIITTEMLTGALSGEMAGMISSWTDGNANEITDVFMQLTTECYTEITNQPHVSFLTKLRDTVGFNMKENSAFSTADNTNNIEFNTLNYNPLPQIQNPPSQNYGMIPLAQNSPSVDYMMPNPVGEQRPLAPMPQYVEYSMEPQAPLPPFSQTFSYSEIPANNQAFPPPPPEYYDNKRTSISVSNVQPSAPNPPQQPQFMPNLNSYPQQPTPNDYQQSPTSPDNQVSFNQLQPPQNSIPNPPPENENFQPKFSEIVPPLNPLPPVSYPLQPPVQYPVLPEIQDPGRRDSFTIPQIESEVYPSNFQSSNNVQTFQQIPLNVNKNYDQPIIGPATVMNQNGQPFYETPYNTLAAPHQSGPNEGSTSMSGATVNSPAVSKSTINTNQPIRGGNPNLLKSTANSNYKQPGKSGKIDNTKACAKSFGKVVYDQLSKSPDFNQAFAYSTSKSLIEKYICEISRQSVKVNGFSDACDEVFSTCISYIKPLRAHFSPHTCAEKISKAIMVPMYKMGHLKQNCEERAIPIVRNILKDLNRILHFPISSKKSTRKNFNDNSRESFPSTKNTQAVSYGPYPQYANSQLASPPKQESFSNDKPPNVIQAPATSTAMVTTNNHYPNYDDYEYYSDTSATANSNNYPLYNSNVYPDNNGKQDYLVPNNKPMKPLNYDASSSSAEAESSSAYPGYSDDYYYYYYNYPYYYQNPSVSQTPDNSKSNVLSRDQESSSPPEENSRIPFQPGYGEFNQDQSSGEMPIQKSDINPVQSPISEPESNTVGQNQGWNQNPVVVANPDTPEKSSDSEYGCRNDAEYTKQNSESEPVQPKQSGPDYNKLLKNPNPEMASNINKLMMSCSDSVTQEGFNYNKLTATMAEVSKDMKNNHPDWSADKTLTMTYLTAIVGCTQRMQSCMETTFY